MSRLSPINTHNFNDAPPDDDPYHFSFRNDDETPNFPHKSPSHRYDPYIFSQPVGAPGTDSNRETLQRNGVQHKYQKEIPKKKATSSVIIHIKLSATMIKEIRCNLDDNVLELANNFCKENNLSLEAVPVIINMIKQQFSVMLKRMRENINPQENSGSSDDKVNSKLYNNSQPNINNSQRTDTLKRTMGIKTDNILNQKLVGKLEVTLETGPQGLYLFEGEDPVKVAYQFCKEHSLPLDLVEVLAIKLEKIRRWYEQKKQQEQQEPQYEHRNPFKAAPAANQDKQSTSSTSFYQYGTAAFATEESDVGDALENNESKKDQVTSKQKFIVEPNDDYPAEQASKNKEYQTTDRARPKQVQPSFKEPNFEDEEITQPVKQQQRKASKSPVASNKSPMAFANQNSQANKVTKAAPVLDNGLDISPRDAEKKLTKNQAQNLMQRLYYDGKAKESIVQVVRGANRSPPREEDSMAQGSDLNKSRGHRKSPSPPKIVSNVSDNKSPKNANMVTTKGNFAFQPKTSEQANTRIVDPKTRSRSPIYEKFSIENLIQQNKEKPKQAVTTQKRQSPERREAPSHVQSYLQSKLGAIKEEEKKSARMQGGEEKPKDSNKPKPKYFQQSINSKTKENNKTGAGVIIRKNSKEVQDDCQGNSFNWKGDYRELFEKLDSDRDGFISAQNINLRSLPPKLADAFTDLVDMLQDTDLVLDYKGFLTALDQLRIDEKILAALERGSARQTSSKVQAIGAPTNFGRKGSPKGQRNPADEMLSPEFGDEPMLTMGKTPSKRSEISTASSNQTENSTRSTKFYPELLDRKV